MELADVEHAPVTWGSAPSLRDTLGSRHATMER